MHSLSDLTELAQTALLLAVAVSLPVVGIAAVVGLLVAALQAVTQLQDATIAHLPRFLVVALALALAGPWMGEQIASFALQAFGGG
ncbi:MAG TPA: type III secretion system export apparatus subunit SctS [Polyangiaceae bacterium]|nr:type III secretion system export apparatus subunit SctS [Polyangiaceae bacterium]